MLLTHKRQLLAFNQRMRRVPGDGFGVGGGAAAFSGSIGGAGACAAASFFSFLSGFFAAPPDASAAVKLAKADTESCACKSHQHFRV
jgi:hypothetical protein